MTEERRAYQRFHLPQPVAGRFGEHDVELLEVSAAGTHVRSRDELAVGTSAPLTFRWRDEDLDVAAEIVWFEDHRAGIRFREFPDLLRRLLEEAVTELLRAQEANAAGDRERNVIESNDALTSSSGRFPVANVFVTWTFSDGAWERKSSLIPEQPPNGFTVSVGEEPERVELLRRTYATGDEEARRLIRMFAELSVRR